LRAQDTAAAARPLTENELVRALQRFAKPNWRRSLAEIVVTAVPLALLWLVAWWALSVSWVLTLLLAIPAAGLLVRLFLIQHDCGHGAFFENRHVNDWIGRTTSGGGHTPFIMPHRAISTGAASATSIRSPSPSTGRSARSAGYAIVSTAIRW